MAHINLSTYSVKYLLPSCPVCRSYVVIAAIAFTAGVYGINAVNTQCPLAHHCVGPHSGDVDDLDAQWHPEGSSGSPTTPRGSSPSRIHWKHLSQPTVVVAFILLLLESVRKRLFEYSFESWTNTQISVLDCCHPSSFETLSNFCYIYIQHTIYNIQQTIYKV